MACLCRREKPNCKCFGFVSRDTGILVANEDEFLGIVIK